MKTTVLLFSFIFCFFIPRNNPEINISSSLNSITNEISRKQKPGDKEVKKILRVPADHPTIAEAVAGSGEGDWIIISPGIYHEKEIEVKKAVVISSGWKLNGDISVREETIIDSDDKVLFSIKADGTEISGLKIINGNHTLDISARVSVLHNHFIDNLDAMSFEPGSGGHVAFNIAENDRDDAIDMDIGGNRKNFGSDILVENNSIINCRDDGIEIRLFTYPNQNIKYTIRKNNIQDSRNAGIQLISYDTFTGKEFYIHHNVLRNCKVGLGCMGGVKTVEDLNGADKMDEKVFLFNNTITGNEMAATGGNTVVAFNNIAENNRLGGFKRFGKNSVILNNLFYGNGGENLIEINDSAMKAANHFASPPSLDQETFMPSDKSPCIDSGLTEVRFNGENIKLIPPGYITGKAPDIGALEWKGEEMASLNSKKLQADAGEDLVIMSPVNEVTLKGLIRSHSGEPSTFSWKMDSGPAEVVIACPGNPETKVVFRRQGLYRFSLDCSDSRSTASDNVIVRYISSGKGKDLFFSDPEKITIMAGDYAYTYGQVKDLKTVKKEQHALVMGSRKKSSARAEIEYSVGTSENRRYFMWILIQSHSPGRNPVTVEFNHKDIGEVPELT